MRTRTSSLCFFGLLLYRLSLKRISGRSTVLMMMIMALTLRRTAAFSSGAWSRTYYGRHKSNGNKNSVVFLRSQASSSSSLLLLLRSSCCTSRPSLSSSSTTLLKSTKKSPQATTSTTTTTTAAANKNLQSPAPLQLLNLSAITLSELQTIVVAWGHSKFRAAQIYDWVRTKGVTDPLQMHNLPQSLRQQLQQYSTPGSLQLVAEQISPKDGTIKRAYQLGNSNNNNNNSKLAAPPAIIESVLMPYQDGRYTACISSQAGCAQGCVFCATGQMGFNRQLTSCEIFEQVARFQQLLQQQNKELTNVVFMGMGEPLANYRHVVTAIRRMQAELGIGMRRITVSTVGVIPNIVKLARDLPQVRLAVSLHCATDAERSALLPANARYGGLDALMECLRDDYVQVTGRRVTLEWALIAGQNDTIETARSLGKLIERHGLRRDLLHVNVIPLNPTQDFAGKASQRHSVNRFCETLEREYGVACTPRVRRGIDIDAGCGQLSNKIMQKNNKDLTIKMDTNDVSSLSSSSTTVPRKLTNLVPLVEQSNRPIVGVYDDGDDETETDEFTTIATAAAASYVDDPSIPPLEYYSLEGVIDTDWEDFEDPEFSLSTEQEEAERLIALVQGTTINLSALHADADGCSEEDAKEL